MTLPFATVADGSLIKVPSVSPIPVSVVIAVACGSPMRFGTNTGGPEDTTKFTAEFGSTKVPDDGLCEITLPATTVVDDCKVTVPNVSFAPERVKLAVV